MNNNLTEKPKQSNQNATAHLRLLDTTTCALMQHKVSARAFQVFVVILYHRHRKTGKCKLYTETIAQEIGCERRAVERALEELEREKLISWKSGRGKSGRGLQGGNEYFFPGSLLYPDSNSDVKPPDAKQKAPPNSPQIKVNASAQKTAAPSPAATDTETLDEYLARKQAEFPQHDVAAVWKDFTEKCGSERYPNMKPTKRKFDQWLQKQDEIIQPLPPEPFDEDAFIRKKYGSKKSGDGEYVNPITGKRLK
jgi:predicted transcriptional regulator